MIRYLSNLSIVEAIDQDLFDVVIHGCNCFHTMGAGVAKALAARFPAVSAVDRDCTTYGNIRKLGTFSFCNVETQSGQKATIINLYTQFGYGRRGPKGRILDTDDSPGCSYVAYDDPSIPQLDLVALRVGLESVRANFGGQGLRYGMPQIGCGFGGGDWPQVLSVIKTTLSEEDVTILDFGHTKF